MVGALSASSRGVLPITRSGAYAVRDDVRKNHQNLENYSIRAARIFGWAGCQRAPDPLSPASLATRDRELVIRCGAQPNEGYTLHRAARLRFVNGIENIWK